MRVLRRTRTRDLPEGGYAIKDEIAVLRAQNGRLKAKLAKTKVLVDDLYAQQVDGDLSTYVLPFTAMVGLICHYLPPEQAGAWVARYYTQLFRHLSVETRNDLMDLERDFGGRGFWNVV